MIKRNRSRYMGNVISKQQAIGSLADLLVISFAAIALLFGGLYYVVQNPVIAQEAKWLVSRASAIIAYILLNIIIITGGIQGHPRNKDTWKLGRYLYSWHLALLPTFFIFVFIHVLTIGSDPKSGVTLGQVLLPVGVKYDPVAIIFGTAALYLLLSVLITAAYRKRIKFSRAVHRLAWLTWLLVTVHGLWGGTDKGTLWPLYDTSIILMLLTFCWRNWPDRSVQRKGTMDMANADS